MTIIERIDQFLSTNPGMLDLDVLTSLLLDIRADYLDAATGALPSPEDEIRERPAIGGTLPAARLYEPLRPFPAPEVAVAAPPSYMDKRERAERDAIARTVLPEIYRFRTSGIAPGSLFSGDRFAVEAYELADALLAAARARS